jgi:hypothetical protein
MRSRFVRNSPGFQTAVDQNTNALHQIGEPTVAIMGEPASEYRGKSTDYLWGGDKRRAFRQQQQEQLGLAPMADRRAMITARAQGRRLSPEMAAMQRTDPIMAAIVGRDPAAAATFATNREQMSPEFMERQARGQAIAGYYSNIPNAADPGMAVAAAPSMMRSLMGPAGGMVPGASPSLATAETDMATTLTQPGMRTLGFTANTPADVVLRGIHDRISAGGELDPETAASLADYYRQRQVIDPNFGVNGRSRSAFGALEQAILSGDPARISAAIQAGRNSTRAATEATGGVPGIPRW